MAGHVVEEDGQRQLRHQLLVELRQLGLTGGKVVGWGRNHAVSTVVGSLLCQSHALLDARVGDARQQRQASAVDAARLLDHLLADVVAQTLLLAGGSQHEEAVYATLDEVLYQPFQTLYVQCLVVLQRCYQRRNDAAQRSFECCFHCYCCFLDMLLTGLGGTNPYHKDDRKVVLSPAPTAFALLANGFCLVHGRLSLCSTTAFAFLENGFR